NALLVCNVSFALCLIVSTIYLKEPERFTSLPTILLLSTLFRLGLNISTTRQILSGAPAPGIITTFGGFVVGGNLVVGIVIFAIITLIQFLVIAKGAERIAEVAARFTLDAMPGKQMSIDADMRAGILSLSEARERRRELHRESKLYGALDGAMKFVKGDAIAGMLITGINIAAGLTLGVTSHGLTLGESFQRYGLYTIGDGLVSQVPALLVAVAAGIAVTRVSDSEHHLVGRDMMGQLAREPQALFTSAAVLLALTGVPGLPALPFLAMAALLVVAGQSAKRRAVRPVATQPFRPSSGAPLTLTLSPPAAKLLHEEGAFPIAAAQFRSSLFDKWGVLLPEPHFRIDPALTGCVAELRLRGAPLGAYAVDETLPAQALTTQLEKSITRCLSEVIDDTQTRMLLELHQPMSEDIINSVVPEQLPVTALTGLLRELVRERVSVQPLGAILQAVGEHRLTTTSRGRRDACDVERDVAPGVPASMLSAVRGALRRSITERVLAETSVSSVLDVMIVAPELDQRLAKLWAQHLTVEPEERQHLVAFVERLRVNTSGAPTVVIASAAARRHLADILLDGAPDVWVLAPGEIAPGVELRFIARLTGDSESSSRAEASVARAVQWRAQTLKAA
ncbi:MAG: FHIPEP family type III secretion protein, partial [Bdellovibrionales bacterium]|nr:FHIPEP family type III secretion protein [Bdellovibrionales bacterium]